MIDTTSNKKPSNFSLPPPRKQTPEEFIAGAGKPPADIVAPPPSSVPRLPWEGLDDSLRRPQQPYRLTGKEVAVLEFVVQNKPGVRSKHAYVLEALLNDLKKDIKTLTGEDIDFTGLAE